MSIKMNAPRGPMGGPRGGRRGAKPKNFNKSIKQLLAFIRPYYIPMIIAVICTVIACVLSIIGPSKLSDISTAAAKIYYNSKGLYNPITNTYFADGTSFVPTEELFDIIKTTGIMLLCFYGASFILHYLQSFILTGVNQRVTKKFRQEISEKINKIPLSYFDHSSYGDILSRVTNDVDTIGQSLNQSITSLVSSITMLFGVVIAMMVTCWQMGLTTIAIVPVTFLFIMIIAKISQKYFKDQQIALGALNGTVEESYSGAIVVKAFNGEEEAINEFSKSNDRIYQNAWKSNVLSSLMMPISNFISNVDYVFICIVGGILYKGGSIEIGTITAFVIYLNLFKSPIQQISQIMTYIQQMAASSERVFEFLSVKEQDPDCNNPVEIANVAGEVVFDHVKFSYYEDRPIIKDFSAIVKPGYKVAIVGPTGAGKTTIVNLLMRFYEINEGSIRIDGVNTKEMRRSYLRGLFSMVLQDTWIFNGTIRDNIVYSKENVTDDDVIKACKAANLWHFIEAQPHGLDTILSEKTALSEGQRQLLTIARAMIQNSPMLILDEATSNVDTRTEILIQDAMDKLTEGRTSFVIAHRLSTIKNADLILVLRDGNIIEQGNHEELLRQNGFYAQLYNSQFEEI